MEHQCMGLCQASYPSLGATTGLGLLMPEVWDALKYSRPS